MMNLQSVEGGEGCFAVISSRSVLAEHGLNFFCIFSGDPQMPGSSRIILSELTYIIEVVYIERTTNLYNFFFSFFL